MRLLLMRAVRAFPSLGWPAVTMGSLLVGMVALTSAPARDGQGRPASRLLLQLPDPVMALAAASGALAVMLLFAFLLALARLRRKDEEVRRALWGMLLLPLVVAVAALWHDGSLERLFLPPPGQYAPSEGQEAAHSGPEPPTTSVPLFTAAVGALVVGAGVASLGLACWILFGDRLAEWWAGPAAAGAREPFAAAVEESLDDLRLEADARLAIIRCYRRFEQVLARSRVPRAPWQTPLEFMREALGRRPLPPDAVRQLTRLFELARFSDEPLAPADRDAAWESLLSIQASLERKERDVPAV